MIKDENRIKVALEYYLKRGAGALEALRGGDFIEFSNLLTWRNAAFISFKQAQQRVDQVVDSNSDSSSDTAEIKKLWQQIVELNAMLEVEIKNQLQDLGKELDSIKRTKATLGKFRSHRERQTGGIVSDIA